MIGVTGGSGYVGSWLARRLLGEGFEVHVIDIKKPPFNCNFVRADINEPVAVSEAIKGCDVVYHLAAVVSKVHGLEDRRYCIQTNVIGTLNILEACRKHHVNRMVYMGTSEVLGEPLYTPTDEGHPRRPKTTYGITKSCAEDLCYEYFVTYGLKVVIPRLYMIYGEDDFRPLKYHSAMGKFIYHALNDQPPTAYNGCIRSWLHIADCVDALMLLKDKGRLGEVYNITAPPSEKLSMIELARMVLKLCGKTIQPIVKEPPASDTKVKLPSGNKAYNELGWRPKRTLNNELHAVVESWKKHLGKG